MVVFVCIDGQRSECKLPNWCEDQEDAESVLKINKNQFLTLELNNGTMNKTQYLLLNKAQFDKTIFIVEED